MKESFIKNLRSSSDTKPVKNTKGGLTSSSNSKNKVSEASKNSNSGDLVSYLGLASQMNTSNQSNVISENVQIEEYEYYDDYNIEEYTEHTSSIQVSDSKAIRNLSEEQEFKLEFGNSSNQFKSLQNQRDDLDWRLSINLDSFVLVDSNVNDDIDQ